VTLSAELACAAGEAAVGSLARQQVGLPARLAAGGEAEMWPARPRVGNLRPLLVSHSSFIFIECHVGPTFE
jgi:hypothetical protein